MPLSGILSEYGFDGGWPSIFYVFGAVGTIWCVAFLLMVYEDPESHPRISEDEKKYILSALWGNAGASVSMKKGFSRDSQVASSSNVALASNDNVVFHSLRPYRGSRSLVRYRSGLS